MLKPEKEVRLIPIYLNGVRWKYMAIDLLRTSLTATMQVAPQYIEPRARKMRSRGVPCSSAAYIKSIIFERVNIPLRPDLFEVGYYGVDWNLRVNEHGHIIYDLPDDPEVEDGKMGTSKDGSGS